MTKLSLLISFSHFYFLWYENFQIYENSISKNMTITFPATYKQDREASQFICKEKHLDYCQQGKH